MNFKKEIETALNSLSDLGRSRSMIEADLGYSPNYIDQVLSKGGNKKFANILNTYLKNVLEKATPSSGRDIELPTGHAKVTMGDYIDLLKEQNQFLKELVQQSISGVKDVLQAQIAAKDEILVAINSALNSGKTDQASEASPRIKKASGRTVSLGLDKTKTHSEESPRPEKSNVKS